MTTPLAGFFVSGAVAAVIASNVGDLSTEMAYGVAIGCGIVGAGLSQILVPEPAPKPIKGANKKPATKKKGPSKNDQKKKKNAKKGNSEKKTEAPKPKKRGHKGEDTNLASAKDVLEETPFTLAKTPEQKAQAEKERAAAAKAAKTAAEAKARAAAAKDAKKKKTADDDDSWERVEDPKAGIKARKAEKIARKQAAESDGKEKSSSGPSATMDVKREKYGILIGPEGSTLKAICAATGANINIPRKDSNSTLITIEAEEQSSVDKAKSAIKQLLEKGYSSATHPGWVTNEVTVPSVKFGAIIGQGGKNIKAIQTATSTRISLPDRDEKATTAKVGISGLKSHVQVAKAAITSLIDLGFSSITHPGWVKIEVDFPRKHLRSLIGTKGQTIKSMQGDTKCKISIPDAEDPNQAVIIAGPEGNVERCRNQVLKLLETLDAPEQKARAEEAAWNGEDDDEDVPAEWGAPGGSGDTWGGLNTAGGAWDVKWE